MIFNKEPRRIIAILALYFIEKTHQLIFFTPTTDQAWTSYYINAANCDLLIIAISGFLLDGKLRRNIQFINLLAIFMDLVGFLLYFSYLPIFMYNLAINILYFLQYVLLLSKNGRDIKYINNFLGRIILYFGYNRRGKHDTEKKK